VSAAGQEARAACKAPDIWFRHAYPWCESVLSSVVRLCAAVVSGVGQLDKETISSGCICLPVEDYIVQGMKLMSIQRYVLQ